MIVLVLIWGFEYVAAKYALSAFDTMTIIFIKYSIAAVVIGSVKFLKDGKTFIRKKDILTYIACAILGEILYFYCEYEAMSYMPVALITIVLAFVPIVSIITERVIYKVSATPKMIAGIVFCIIGVVVIIGVDIEEIMQGQFVGYLFCVGAVMSWNAYNFVTKKLGENYTDLTLTFNQMVCTLLLSGPVGIAQFTGFDEFADLKVLGGILFLGIFCAGIGFYIYIYALTKLGPTPMAVYSNFLPVSTALFGWICLGEALSLMQIAGGIIVIFAGLVVIIEKGRLDDLQ